MGTQGCINFVVLVVLFVSLNGKSTSKPNTTPNSQGQTVIVNGKNNAVGLGDNEKIETALTQINKKLESLDEKITSLVSSSGSRSKLLHNFYLSFFFRFRKVIHTYTYISYSHFHLIYKKTFSPYNMLLICCCCCQCLTVTVIVAGAFTATAVDTAAVAVAAAAILALLLVLLLLLLLLLCYCSFCHRYC